MKIDLIALDMDDTLLREDLTVSEGNKAALAEADAAGIRIVLASGRNIHSMRHYAELLGLDGIGDYLICTNGTEIIESATGRLLDERRLSPELCRDIARHIESRGFPWQIYEHGLIHVSEPNQWALEDSRLTGQSAILVEDREAFFSRGLLKFVVPGESAAIAGLMAELGAALEGRARVVTSKPYFLEVLPLDADKGLALVRLAAMLGIEMPRVMAIGDALNDLGMVRAAGWGCAPSNAVPEVKAAARVVSSLSHQEDAVADLVRRVALAG
ncbi:MAG: Cof-type HAD-IIB family hydrolase [Spirochaetaceae bacterium]|nr:Cof-type HAD-IIB family hydrolase [Spirochaetaceae bacterium]